MRMRLEKGLASPGWGEPASASIVRGWSIVVGWGCRGGPRPARVSRDVPLRGRGREASQGLLPELLESAQNDMLPHPLHGVKVEPEVVEGHERRGRDLARHVEVAEVRAARAPAGRAGAGGV